MIIFEVIAGEKLTYEQAKEINPVAKDWSMGILTPKLPFSTYTHALRCRKHLLSFMGRHIGRYMDMVEAKSDEELS